MQHALRGGIHMANEAPLPSGGGIPGGEDADTTQVPAEADDEEEEDEDAQLQKKLCLFQCATMQQSLRRFWPLLALDGNGELTMDGYVEINIRLQKALTEQFFLERAVDSAIGDWGEDVQPGQQSMNMDEFAMFLFELSSLWCGPNVALPVYLMFTNAVFIAVTDSRGAHTIGFKPIEAIDRLPAAFFDLLSLQGWAPAPEVERAMSEEQALHAWMRLTVSEEAQQAAVEHVQRQIFQLTHDVRSVFLFRSQDGKDSRGHDLLDLVRSSTKGLTKVQKSELPPLALALPGRSASKSAQAAHQTTLALSGSSSARRGHSVPGLRQPRALPATQREPPALDALPVGRTYATQVVRYQGRGLALAGQAALASNRRVLPSGESLVESSSSMHFLGGSSEHGAATVSLQGAAETEPPRTGESYAPSSEHGLAERSESREGYQVQVLEVQGDEQQQVPSAEAVANANFFEGSALPSYELPRKPAGIYAKQVGPLMSIKPGNLVYEVNKFQTANPMLPEPFERTLRKLPEDVRPLPNEVPAGPMSHPSEPVWFSMQHRLEAILRKQGRRVEKRRKRRQRNKLFHGRPPKPQAAKRNEGRELREYFDRSFAEQGRGHDVPGEANGEFLGKVHESYMVNRDQLETRWKVGGLGGHPVEKYQIGSSMLRAPKVVRPVYVPPPGATMVGP